MNGRYFAGKQITCEFVALTRWKAAICGEYMRSRCKTCSHGVACNFIHCFRNPGGDYEWSDWDNPPPKFWIRKMAALFGPSADTKAIDNPDFEGSQGSDRKRQRSSADRYVSRRHRDNDVHKEHSFRDYYNSKEDHGSHSLKHGQSQHRRDTYSSDKNQSREIEENTGKHSSVVKNEKKSHKHMHEERYTHDHVGGGNANGDKSRSRKHRSDQRLSLEPRSSDWSSDYTDPHISRNPSASKSASRYDNDKRSRRQSSEDPKRERHYSMVHESMVKEHSSKRRSCRYIEDDYPDKEDSGRSKSRKGKDHYDSDERWVATNSDVDSDVEKYPRSSSKGSKLEWKDEAHSDAEIDIRSQVVGQRSWEQRMARGEAGSIAVKTGSRAILKMTVHQNQTVVIQALIHQVTDRKAERRMFQSTDRGEIRVKSSDSSSDTSSHGWKSSKENVSKHKSRRNLKSE